MDKNLGKIAIDAPVSIFISIGYRTAGDFSFDAHVIKFSTHCTKAALDSTKTFAICQLGEGHAKKLIETGERLDLVVASIALHALPKGVQGQMVDDLGENQFA